jgi:hypothetical protein
VLSSAHVCQGNAYIGEKTPIRIVIDFDILTVPVDQARQSMRQFHAQQAAYDNPMSVSLDDLLDLTFGGRQGTSEQGHPG